MVKIMWNNNYFGNSYGQVPSPMNGFYCVVVQSESEVQNYLVAANSTVLLISFNLKKFWLKGTDQNGIALPLREFEFGEKVTQPKPPEQAQQNVSPEIEALKKEMEELRNMVSASLGGNKA